MKLSQIPKVINLKVIMDGDFESLGLVSHDNPTILTFLEDHKFIENLYDNRQIDCIITKEEYIEDIPEHTGIAISQNPRHAFYSFHNYLATKTQFYGESFPTLISPSAQIHPTSFIADKNVRIGDRVIIEPQVSILERVILEEDVIIRAGSVIGSEGFQFYLSDGKIFTVVHGGGVYLHRGVEVQSNSCIDRSIFGGYTDIDEDTKIDNLVHIAHNVRIGKRCRVVALAMIAGSVTIDDDVWIGPSAAVSSEINIGKGAYVSLGAVVTQHVKKGQRVSGNFAIDHKKFLNFLRSIR